MVVKSWSSNGTVGYSLDGRTFGRSPVKIDLDLAWEFTP